MNKLHIITPFYRIDTKEFYLHNLKDKNIVWHPLFQEKEHVFKEDWIEPIYVENMPEDIHPNIYKINIFIKHAHIEDDDYYGFMNDDDWIEPNVFYEIVKRTEDVVFISMKRGYQIPDNGNCPHGITTLIPHEGVGVGFIGLEQIFVKGEVLKTLEFENHVNFDGLMAEELQKKYEVKYLNNVFALFNFLEEGRWDKPIKETTSMETIAERFERVKREPRDISEHLDTLLEYGKKCDTVVELGINEGISTTAWAMANISNFYCYDYIPPNPMFQLLLDACVRQGVKINHEVADSLKIEIPECDLLFIDTLHTGEQLAEELRLHSGNTKKWIIMHDTEAFRDDGIVENSMGLKPAIDYFLEDHPEWILKEHFTNNNGLTILERTKDFKTAIEDVKKAVEKQTQKKKYLLSTSAYSNPDLLMTCIKSWPVLDNVDRLIFFDGVKWEEVFKDFLQEEDLDKHLDTYFSAYAHCGASGGWNQILRYGFEVNDYDYVIIMGSDTEMKDGFWDKLIEDLEREKPDFSCCLGFNCIVMNRKCYNTVGNFDENFYVFYYEDNDYDARVRLSKDTIKYHNCGDESLLGHYGSAVIRKDERFNKANGITFSINQKYYVDKWGVKDLQKISEISYDTPFNNPSLTVRDWTLDEKSYLQKKDVWDKANEEI